MNRITSLLGIQYPIVQGGMVWCSGWRLASAVSNAGGLGLIGAGSMHPEILREHIRKCRVATEFPFGVNIPLMYPQIEEIMNIVVEEGVKIIFYFCRESENMDRMVERAWNYGCSYRFFFPFCCEV